MSPRQIREDDIEHVQKKLNIRLPEEYISHLLSKDSDELQDRGLFIEVKEEVWERPKPYEVAEAWSFLYGIHTYTACEDSADWMQLSCVGAEFIQETGIQAVPILTVVGDADCYCADTHGKIVKYNHEENIVEQTNLSFWDVFELELKELKQRKEKKTLNASSL